MSQVSKPEFPPLNLIYASFGQQIVEVFFHISNEDACFHLPYEAAFHLLK